MSHGLPAGLYRRDDADACDTGNDFDGRLGLRISSVFVILVTSTFGALFPVLAKRYPGLGIPNWAFFFAKYFGSGVIIATSLIHLLAPANDALGDPCLTGPITEYDWVEGIALMSIFSLFAVELIVMRYSTFAGMAGTHSHSPTASSHDEIKKKEDHSGDATYEPHLSHVQDHHDVEAVGREADAAADYAAQVTAVFILEFGIIFHSCFIGLTLAVSGAEFTTLYIVIVFHQMFEGLGLGTRIAVVNWAPSKRHTPYVLAMMYGLTTPIAIAAGLGVRNSYPPGSSTTLIVNGVFDSISAGILLYTGLVELMAHEFLFSHELRNAPARRMFTAFGYMVAGAGLMALLGKWA